MQNEVFNISNNYNKIQDTKLQIKLLTLSASSTSQILMPVAGLKVANVFPLLDVCHSLLIKICGKWKVFSDTGIKMFYMSDNRHIITLV